MKKFRFSLAVSLFLLLLGCQSEDLENQPIPIGNHSLVAMIEGQDYIDVSRTAVDDSGNVTWITTDELGVYGSISENVKYSSTGNGSDVTFTGNLPETETAEWAYYPYNKDASLNEGELTITLPDQYTYTGNSNAPMLGKPSGNDKFSFKHLGGLIRFTLGGGIPDDAGRFVITSMGEKQPIAGQASFAIEGDNVTMSITSEGKQSISYDVSAIKDAEEFQHFFVPLPIGDYAKLEVSFYKKNSETPVFTRSLSNLTVKRAEMICMPILDWNTGKQYTLSENTTDLTDLSEDGVTVTLKESDNSLQLTGLEESEIPEVGQILWSQPTEELPYGFMGKVKETTSSNGTVTITTETVGLDEVFDELLIEEAVDLVPTTDSRSTSTAIGVEKTYTIPIDIQDEGSAYGINGKLNIASQLKSTIHINKEKSVNRMDFSLTFNPNLDAEMEVGASFNEDKEMIPFELKDFNFPPISLGGVFTINPALQFKLYIAPSGKISFKTDVDYNTTCVAGADYQDGQWKYGINEVNHNNQSPWNMTSTIDMSGSLFLGAGVEFKGKIYNRDDLKIYIEPIIGIELSGELAIKSDDNKMQETLKDASLTTENVASGKFGIDATVLAEQAEASFCFEEKRWGEKQLYLLPMFENLAAQVKTMSLGSRSSMDPFEATITMTAVRELLFNYVLVTTTIINEQYEEDSQSADYVDYKTTGDENQSQNFSMKFEYLDPMSSYRGYPAVYNPTLKKTIELSEKYVSFHSPSMDLRDKLIALYNATGGENWTNKDNWLSNQPIETWYGVYEKDNEYIINLSSNNLTGTFIINDPSIVEIHLDSNPGLTSVNVAECTSLKTLYYDKDVVTSLDVSSCNTLFKEDNWDINEVGTTGTYSVLTSLVARNLHSVTSFNNMDTNWELLDLSGCENLESIGHSASEATHIGTLKLSGCKKMTNEGIHWVNYSRYVDVLDISGSNGMIYGRAEKEIYAQGNTSVKAVTVGNNMDIVKCNVSGCENLEKIIISGEYSLLNIEGCVNLSNLELYGDNYFSQDLSLYTNLDTLRCKINTSLNLSKNPKLKKLILTEGSVGELDLSGNNELEEIILGNESEDSYADSVTFTKLTLPYNSSLKSIKTNKANLPTLDISSSYALETISLYGSNISEPMELDITQLKSFKRISMSGKYQVTSLNARGCTNLESAYIDSSVYPTVDVSGCNKLKYLKCSVDGLLDLRDCTNLSSLYCGGSKMTGLNISGLTQIETFDLYSSQLTSVDLSDCKSLETLNIWNTPLLSLDLSGLSALKKFDCYENGSLSSLNLTGCASLETFKCYQNGSLSTLNLTGCTSLKEWWCYENLQLENLTLMSSAPLGNTIRLDFSNTKINCEIPDYLYDFENLTSFKYDQRYTDYKTVWDSANNKWVVTYTDNGYGWWFPGEPDSGRHGR